MKSSKNNSGTKWMSSGLVAAFVASLCCITPVAASLAGISGVASTFSFMEPIRPFLIGLTILILGFAWYQKLKPKSQEEIECACDENPSFIQSKAFLGIVTVLAAVLMAFPYYSEAFFPKQEKNVVYVQQSQVQTITLHIEDMTCTGCEATVKNAAYQLEGVLNAEADYQTGKAVIKYDQSKITPGQIEEAINKTGFTVKKNT